MVRPVRFVCGVGLFLSILACGGGGASVTPNLYAGTWSGTFSWKEFKNAVQQGNTITGNGNGTVASNGSFQLDSYIQPPSTWTIDRLIGSVSTSTGQAIGTYTYAIKWDNSNPNPNIYSMTATFQKAGNNLTVNAVGVAGGGVTEEITMILTKN